MAILHSSLITIMVPGSDNDQQKDLQRGSRENGIESASPHDERESAAEQQSAKQQSFVNQTEPTDSETSETPAGAASVDY